jgi:hypothetical protein
MVRKLVAGKWVMAQCAWQCIDLDRSGKTSFPLRTYCITFETACAG